jgi:hypothetical protein
VLELAPSAYLTQNEITAARLANYGGRFNPQQQFAVTWPDHPVVALAYLDQLERAKALPPEKIATLRQALTQAAAEVDQKKTDDQLASRIGGLASGVPTSSSDPATATRASALRQALGKIAEQLR